MIFVFSGTGNSLYVAHRLSGILGDKVIQITKGCQLLAPDNGRIIWVFPVYSWGIPPVVQREIESYRHGANVEHFAVMTCGDDTGNTHRQWRRLINKLGGRPMSTYSVQMPNTYVLMKGFDVDPDNIANDKLNRADARISNIADQIKSGTANIDDVTTGDFAWVKSTVIYPWFKRFAMSPRPFHPTDACIRCGLCAKSCPMQNIIMDGSQPSWGNDCALCLRCYHICPTRAVAYGNATLNKGQYKTLIKTTLQDEDRRSEAENTL